MAPDPSQEGGDQDEKVIDVRLVNYMFVPDTCIEVFDHVRIKQIACGRYHTLFLTQEGEVYACGQHKHG